MTTIWILLSLGNLMGCVELGLNGSTACPVLSILGQMEPSTRYGVRVSFRRRYEELRLFQRLKGSTWVTGAASSLSSLIPLCSLRYHHSLAGQHLPPHPHQ